ncbi:hypothetical protein Tco_0321248 [Tanacetum coccineum]
MNPNNTCPCSILSWKTLSDIPSSLQHKKTKNLGKARYCHQTGFWIREGDDCSSKGFAILKKQIQKLEKREKFQGTKGLLTLKIGEGYKTHVEGDERSGIAAADVVLMLVYLLVLAEQIHLQQQRENKQPLLEMIEVKLRKHEIQAEQRSRACRTRIHLDHLWAQRMHEEKEMTGATRKDKLQNREVGQKYSKLCFYYLWELKKSERPRPELQSVTSRNKRLTEVKRFQLQRS